MESAILFLLILYREHSSLNNFTVRDEQASPVSALLRSLYHELRSRSTFAVRDEQASPVPALLRSLYYIRPADTGVFTAVSQFSGLKIISPSYTSPSLSFATSSTYLRVLVHFSYSSISAVRCVSSSICCVSCLI